MKLPDVVQLYVTKYPGQTPQEVYDGLVPMLTSNPFVCGVEDVAVLLRMLAVMEGGLIEREGRYFPETT